MRIFRFTAFFLGWHLLSSCNSGRVPAPPPKTMTFDYRPVHERNVKDKLLGIKPIPGVSFEARKTVDGKLSFDAHYGIDEFSRRVVPDRKTRHDNFVLFFGCSVAFGEGLDDDQTIEYLVSEKMGATRVYNYAFCSYGAQQQLARLEEGKIPDQVSEKRGVAIYYYIDEHLRRTLGPLDFLHNWYPMPYYDVENGKVVRKADSFEEGKPFLSWLTEFSFVKSFLERATFKLTDRDFDLFTEILAESKRRFQAQFPGSEYVVLISPDFGERYAGRLTGFLDKKGIRYLDYSSHTEFKAPDFHIPDDGHPTAKWNERLAELLAPDLQKILAEQLVSAGKK